MQISPILWLAAAVGFLALEASTFNMTSRNTPNSTASTCSSSTANGPLK